MRVLIHVFACAVLTVMVGCSSNQSSSKPGTTSAPTAETTKMAVPPSSPEASSLRIAPPFDGLSILDVVPQRIREKEGLRLQSYQGPSGKWLIGYGHAANVKPGMSISLVRAEEFLRQDVAAAEEFIKSVVRVPINAAEFSAMVDLAYNIGTGSFRTSTVLRELNKGDREAAAEGFMLWTKVRNEDGVLVENPQLVRRRSEDRALFLGETYPPP